MTTRRGFISALLGAATLDPERLLWIPGNRLISIPPSTPIEMQLCSVYSIHRDAWFHRIDAFVSGGIQLDEHVSFITYQKEMPQQAILEAEMALLERVPGKHKHITSRTVRRQN